MTTKSILVTGATGYIGGRLVPRLIQAGYKVRCLARDPSRLQNRLEGLMTTCRSETDQKTTNSPEIVQGDVLKPETLGPAVEGIDVAYYLVHSMRSNEKGFEHRDQQAASNFARAAKQASVKQVIYLGGLGRRFPDDPSERNRPEETNKELSAHLRSRQEVGETLRKEGPPVTEFRAAVIVGSGSISFEMIRYLTERVPIMICPSWVRTRCQPIAVDDVLRYLVGAVEEPRCLDKILEIGGADVLTYGDMMLGYAKLRKLWRLLIPVPVLTPRLSSYWVDFVTPIPAAISRPLIEGLRNEVICHDNTAREIFPFEPMNYSDAVAEALDRSERNDIETIWSTAVSSLTPEDPKPKLETKEGMIIETRKERVKAPAEEVYQTFTGIGGRRGWFSCNWAWRLRGLLDRIVGGVGMRRGRRHPDEIYPGEALDFWRVEAVEPNSLMRLRAEMKVPGKAWLQFSIEPTDNSESVLTQTAYFEPKGLFGLVYWYALYPIHAIIFNQMIRAVARRAEKKFTRTQGQEQVVSAGAA
ncbi:MAG: SDR family oxidoreductase [Gemmataceae bacterium]